MIPVLLAQCVMCFRTAAAQNNARAHVLDIGVLLLGIPPFLILAGYCVLFYRKNKQCGEAPHAASAEHTVSRQ